MTKQSQRLETVLQTLQMHLPELRRQYGVKSLGVFGSYVRGEEDKHSDLDVLVEIENDSLTLLQFVHLQSYLSDLLGVKVDLVESSSLKPYIGSHIRQEVIML